MNLQVGERIEAVGLDSTEALDLLYYRDPEPEPLLEDMTAEQRFLLLFKRVKYLSHERKPWTEGAGRYKEQIGEIHSKSVDFAGTSLHLVLSAKEFWREKSTSPDIITAEWSSDQLAQTITRERIEAHDISFWDRWSRPIPSTTLRSLALVEESVGEAERILGIGYRGPNLRQLKAQQEQVAKEEEPAEPTERHIGGRLNRPAALATFAVGETASVVGAVAAHSTEVFAGGTALTIAASVTAANVHRFRRA
jgi:hypothetical protein